MKAEEDFRSLFVAHTCCKPPVAFAILSGLGHGLIGNCCGMLNSACPACSVSAEGYYDSQDLFGPEGGEEQATSGEHACSNFPSRDCPPRRPYHPWRKLFLSLLKILFLFLGCCGLRNCLRPYGLRTFGLMCRKNKAAILICCLRCVQHFPILV